MGKMKSFYDSHLHFVGIGLNALEYIDISKARSFDELKETLNKHTDRSFIIARGYHQENFIEKESFSKSLLNEVSCSIPIIAIRTCGHVLICNDAMMKLANIDQSKPQVPGGTFDFSSGEFTENALELIYKNMPKPDKQRIKEYMAEANKVLLSNGITACGSDDFSTLPVHYELIIEAYKEAYEEGLIDVRILQQVNIPNYEEYKTFIEKGYHKLSFGKFKMGPLKLLADGSLGGRTAYMNDPYTDNPSTKGVSTFTEDELYQLVHLADQNDIDVAIHAIGDGCVDMVLDAIEKSSQITNRNHRHSIIHAQLANHAQIERMKKLHVGAQTQPIFLNSDIPIIEKRIGKRSEESYLFHTMYQKGIKTTISTDCPVEDLNPFDNIYCAITRKSIKHNNLMPFIPDEAFTLKEALIAYTVTPYYFSYEEFNNYNDFIVINKDIKEVDSDELLDIKVIQTFIDGVSVYKK